MFYRPQNSEPRSTPDPHSSLPSLSFLTSSCFLFLILEELFCWLRLTKCGILGLPPATETAQTALKAWCLNPITTRQVLWENFKTKNLLCMEKKKKEFALQRIWLYVVIPPVSRSLQDFQPER